MPANEQLLQRLLNVYGNDTQSIRHALSGLKGNVYEKGGKKKSFKDKFVQATLGAAMADAPSVMTASGWKYDSDGNLHQVPDEGSERLADNLAVISTLSPTHPATAAVDAGLQSIGKLATLARARKYFNALKASKLSSSEMSGSIGTKAKELSQRQIDDIFNEALGYKKSWQYNILNINADTEATDNLILGYRKDAFTTYPENRPNIIFKELPEGIRGRYVKGKNTIYLDPSRATDNTVYHEALHWLNVGDPTIEIGPNYDAWMSYMGGDKKKEAQLLNAFLKNEDELQRYNSLAPTKKYITSKVHDALYDGYDSYLVEPGELQVNGLTGGRAAGLKPFQEYPGRKVALEYLDKARESVPALYDVAIDDPRGLERTWKILTGNYTPAIGAGLLGGVSAAAYPTDYTEYKSGGKIPLGPIIPGLLINAKDKYLADYANRGNVVGYPSSVIGLLRDYVMSPYNDGAYDSSTPQRRSLFAKYFNVTNGLDFNPDDYIVESEYRPSVSRDGNAKYYTFKADSKKDVYNMFRNEAGRFKIDYGKDENGRYISIYDDWDLAPFGFEGVDHGTWQSNKNSFESFGAKPVELYDRIYESKDPELFSDFYYDANIEKNGGKIHIKPSHRGRFTSLLKRTGKPASWFKAHGTPAQKRMATFALNSRHWKHEDGGPIERAISSNKADVVLAAIRKMKSDVTP